MQFFLRIEKPAGNRVVQQRLAMLLELINLLLGERHGKLLFLLQRLALINQVFVLRPGLVVAHKGINLLAERLQRGLLKEALAEFPGLLHHSIFNRHFHNLFRVSPTRAFQPVGVLPHQYTTSAAKLQRPTKGAWPQGSRSRGPVPARPNTYWPGRSGLNALFFSSLAGKLRALFSRPVKRGAIEHFVGLMSGTSADGIDAAVAAITTMGERPAVQLLAHVHRPFSPALRRRILQAALHGAVAELCELNFILGEKFGAAALAALKAGGLAPAQVRGIGCHGQTFHHLPGGKPPSTLQLGEAAVIAEKTGVTTVADFRVADMAAGGQGAPLVAYADWVLFTDPTRPRIVQNIGGIANLTFLPSDARLPQVLAFDTGPGNMVLDGVVAALSSRRKAFDRNGLWAARGKVCKRLLERALDHPFFRRPPPKTTGREEFGESFLQPFLRQARRSRLLEADTVATATALTAVTIANAYRRFVFPLVNPAKLPRLQVILGGGGAKNPALRRMLEQEIAGMEVLTHADFGISNAAKEALAFAVLARQTLHGLPSNVPAATGARHPAILGKVVLPPPKRSAY